MFKRIFTLLFVVFVFSISSFAQRPVEGQVTSIIDARTFTLQSTNQKLTIRLQAIEIPDPDQPLAEIAKDHLSVLILNKSVRVIFKQLAQNEMICKSFLGDIDISGQMIRDGAAWFDAPNKYSLNSLDQQSYVSLEDTAKSEKRGIWGLPGMLPVWEHRAAKQKALEEKAQAEEVKRQEKYRAQNKPVDKPKRAEIKIILPANIPNIKYIDAATETPKGFVVVGVGYFQEDQGKLLKAVKLPKAEDLVCVGFSIPSTFLGTQNVYSKYCPQDSYGNNALYLADAKSYTQSAIKDAIQKTVVAYRMYRISGNYSEFTVKARDAVSAVNNITSFLPEDDLKTNLMMASSALTDCMIVRSSRDGDYSARLSGSVLIALNDKYELDDVPEILLDDRIIQAGIRYLNRAGSEAEKLGLATMKKSR